MKINRKFRLNLEKMSYYYNHNFKKKEKKWHIDMMLIWSF